MKGWIALGVGILAGNFAFEKFAVKKADGSGWVELGDGLGMDDAWRTGFCVGGVLIARKFLKAA